VGEFLLAVTIAEEAIVANVLESTWKDMDQEAADELVGAECHRLLLVAVTIVLPAETHLAILDVEDAIVGYRDAVCVAADIVQNLLRSGEGALGIDDPFGLSNGSQVMLECVPLSQGSQGGEELQLSGRKCRLQSRKGASINPIFLQRLAAGKGYVWLLARLRLWFERDVLALLRSGQRFLGVVG